MSDTVLLKKDPGASPVYRAPGENDVPYGKNVVYVPRDAKFSLNLEEINPGWLHQESVRKPDAKPGALPNPFSAEDPYLAGKDLWLLINVKTLSTGDVLEFETKRISRATVLKYNMRSFGLIPLTVDEITPFSLEANTDYEVDIRIYEVKNTVLKRVTADFYRNNPGLSGIARTAWGAASSTFKSLVGDPAINAFKKEQGNDLYLERLLLESDGVLQFNGRFAIYRSQETLAPKNPEDNPDGGALVNRYLLADPYKRATTRYDAPRSANRFEDPAGYLKQLESLEGLDTFSRQDATLRFRIESMWSPNEKAAAVERARPTRVELVTEEQARAAESLAVVAHDAFIKAAEDEKTARLSATETFRKTSVPNEAELQDTARILTRKTQEVAAARTAMEAAQARAVVLRQAVESNASKVAQNAIAEKTAAQASAALDAARRTSAEADQVLATVRADLQKKQDAVKDARAQTEARLQAEAAAAQRIITARDELAQLVHKAESKKEDLARQTAVTAGEQTLADAEKALVVATKERELAQQTENLALATALDQAGVVAQKRAIATEIEQAKDRARLAKEQADAVLDGTSTVDPRLNILKAKSL